MTRSVSVAAICLAWLPACNNGPSATPPKTAPATVAAPVKEADLTTVTLSPEAEARLGIKTATIERRAVPRTRTVGGEVVPQPGAAVVVTAPFAGTLEATGEPPTPGSGVERGRAVFRLLPLVPSERDAPVEAERAVGEASARQELATQRVQRAEMLVKDGSGSRRAVEEAQADLGIANAELKAARDRFALARRTTTADGGVTIDVPISGVLRNVHVTHGQPVAAGTSLFDVVRLDTVWIRVPLYVGESAEIDTRAAATIVGLGARPDAAGLVAQPVAAPPSADPTTAAVDLYFAARNPDGQLRPGQRVGARLLKKGASNSLVAPAAALLYDAFGGTWVYEARDPHVYVRRRVVVADQIGTLAVLSQGPEPGTRVVTEGAAELFGTEFGAGK